MCIGTAETKRTAAVTTATVASGVSGDRTSTEETAEALGRFHLFHSSKLRLEALAMSGACGGLGWVYPSPAPLLEPACVAMSFSNCNSSSVNALSGHTQPLFCWT